MTKPTTLFTAALHAVASAAKLDFDTMIDAIKRMDPADAEQAYGIILSRLGVIINRVNECASVVVNFEPMTAAEEQKDAAANELAGEQ